MKNWYIMYKIINSLNFPKVTWPHPSEYAFWDPNDYISNHMR